MEYQVYGFSNPVKLGNEACSVAGGISCACFDSSSPRFFAQPVIPKTVEEEEEVLMSAI
jgi:hypothetical protein